MSYLVLARKWRPRIWDDVVAQDHVTATLRNAIGHDRLAHAYIFSGPRGVGKTSAARILAKSLNCESGPIPTPCNTCSSCQEIDEGRNVDVYEIDGASNRGINEVRSLRENIQYAPAHGKHRIYIIDEVHMLTPEAFNALLKTLEEPPEHVLFIFATTEPQKVPATILSRCQRFDFRRISQQDIITRLQSICEEEQIAIDLEALRLISRKADGSLRDSLSLLDQMVSYTEGRITTEHVVQALGLIDEALFFEVTEILKQHNTADGLALVERIVFSGYDIEEFLLGLSDHLRHLLVVCALNSTDLLDVSDAQKQLYKDVAPSFQEEDLLRLIRIVLDTRAAVKRSVSPRLLLEVAIVKMLKLDETVYVDDLLTRLDNLTLQAPARVDHKPMPVPVEDQSEADPASGETTQEQQVEEIVDETPTKREHEGKQDTAVITVEDVRHHWDEIIRQVRHKKITVGSFLQEGVVLGMNGRTVEVGFGLSNGFHIDVIMRSKGLVLDVMKKILGMAVDLRCVKTDLPKANPKKKKQRDKHAELKDLAEKNPVIGKIVTDFDADVVD